MDVFVSWARATVANVDRTLGRSERYFDRILVAVLIALAIAIALLFMQAGLTPLGVSTGSARACTALRPGSRGTPPGPR